MLAGIKFCLHLPLEYSKMWPEKTIIFSGHSCCLSAAYQRNMIAFRETSFFTDKKRTFAAIKMYVYEKKCYELVGAPVRGCLPVIADAGLRGIVR